MVISSLFRSLFLQSASRRSIRRPHKRRHAAPAAAGIAALESRIVPATVSLAVSPGSISEDTPGTLIYTFTRDLPIGDLVVNFSVGGDAIYQSDYTAVASNPVGFTYGPTGGSITLANGMFSAQIVVVAVSDNLAEGNQTVQLDLAAGGYTIHRDDNSATGIILDADFATVSWQAASNDVGEDGGQASVAAVLTTSGAEVTLESAATFDVAAALLTAESNDFMLDSPTITFSAGAGNGATQGVLVTPASDDLAEGTETIRLSLAQNSGVATVDTGTTTLRILDADTAGLSVSFDLAASDAAEDGGQVSLTATLTAAEGVTLENNAVFSVSPSLVTAEANDFTLNTTQITFQAGSANGASKTIRVTPRSDTLVEGNEVVNLVLDVVSGAAPVGPIGTHALTIIDADLASVSFQAVASTAEEDGGPVQLAAILTTAAGNTLEADAVFNVVPVLGTAEATDYTLNTPQITFVAGSGNGTVQNVVVTPLPDTLVEGSETVNFTLAPFSGAAAAGTAATHELTILDADFANVSFELAGSSTGEDGGPAVLKVVLSTGGNTLEQDAVFDVATVLGSAEAGDFQLNTSQITFVAGSIDGMIQAVVGTPQPDSLVEGPETLDVTLAVRSGAVTVGQGTHALTIADADFATVSFDQTSSMAAEDGGQVSLLVTLLTLPGNTLENDAAFDIAAVLGTAEVEDFVLDTPRITFAAGSGHGAALSVLVTPQSDTLIEANDSVTFTVVPDNQAVTTGLQPSHQLTILDADSLLATVSFVETASSFDEDSGQVAVLLQLVTNGSTLEDQASFSITYVLANAEAADFTLDTPQVTFAAGSRNGDTQGALLTLTSDTLVEGTESLSLSVARSSGVVEVTAPTTNELTIVDADTASVSYQLPLSAASEDGGQVALAVILTMTDGNTLEQNAVFDVAAVLGSAEGADFTLNTPQITFAAGSGAGATQNVLVTPQPDSLVEGPETLDLVLSVNSGVVPVGQGRHTLTIVDTDIATVSWVPLTTSTFSNTTPIAPVDRLPSTAEAGIQPPGTPVANSPSTIAVTGVTGEILSVTVTVTITGTRPGDFDILLIGPQGQRTILISDAGGDGDLLNATFTFDQSAANLFPAGAAPAGTYRPVNYDSGSPLEPFAQDSFPALGGLQDYGAASLDVFNRTNPNGTWSLYVVDDDSGELNALVNGWSLTVTTFISPDRAFEDVGSVDLVAVLSTVGGATLGEDAVFDVLPILGTAESVDLLIDTTQITFAAGSGSGATRIVRVTPLSDTLVEGTETLALELVPNSGPATVGLSPIHNLTVFDADQASISFVLSGSTAVEDGGQHTFTAVLSTEPGNTLENDNAFNVSTILRTAEAVDFTLDTPTVTFAAGSGNGTTQTLRVTPRSDTIVEGSETVDLRLVGNSVVSAGATATHRLTIADSDFASVAFEVTASSAGEDVGQVAIKVVLTSTGVLEKDAVFNVSTILGSAQADDFTIDTTQIRFAAGNVSGATRFVLVSISNDLIDEADETFTVRLTASSGDVSVGSPRDHQITILDNDTGLPLGSEQSSFAQGGADGGAGGDASGTQSASAAGSQSNTAMIVDDPEHAGRRLLVIFGSEDNDRIRLRLKERGSVLGANVNGRRMRFDTDSFDRIAIQPLGGKDRVAVSPKLRASHEIVTVAPGSDLARTLLKPVLIPAIVTGEPRTSMALGASEIDFLFSEDDSDWFGESE